MSAKEQGVRYDNLPQAMRFAMDMHARETIHTSIPAFVVEYDASTKRARLQPAIRRAYYGTDRYEDRAQLLDVPVVSQSTGGFMIYGPVKRGDLMLVMFSERGIQRFKEGNLEEIANPVSGRFFDQMDAVAIKWGVQNIEPVDDEALCLQSDSGNAYIKVKDDSIEIRVGDKGIRITGDNVRLGRNP